MVLMRLVMSWNSSAEDSVRSTIWATQVHAHMHWRQETRREKRNAAWHECPTPFRPGAIILPRASATLHPCYSYARLTTGIGPKTATLESPSAASGSHCSSHCNICLHKLGGTAVAFRSTDLPEAHVRCGA